MRCGAMRRRFNKHERLALFLAADGRSAISDEPLGEDWQADHVVPFSRGGPTNVTNGQAITASENRRKGARMTKKPRGWQGELIESWNLHEPVDYTLAVIPAGGKTMGALFTGNMFLKARAGGKPRRLIIVVPTLPLCAQWKQTALDEFRLQLTSSFTGFWKAGYDGAVLTYQAIAMGRPQLWMKVCSNSDVMVIFDEVHHAGDGATWGDAIGLAFASARKRLSMTGTPFKSDGGRIKWLAVDNNGEYVIHYRYDYPTALRDRIVRSIHFQMVDFVVTEQTKFGTTTYDTRRPLSESEAESALRAAQRDTGFIDRMLSAAIERLAAVLINRPDARALVICTDTEAAVAVSDRLTVLSGERPAVVVSNEAVSTTTITAFKEAPLPRWIVAVKMVSEGVDIPALAVEVYLTTTQTELFFRQASGRIMRRLDSDDPDDDEAYMLVPNVPLLRGFAQTIEEYQRQVREAEDRERRERNANLDPGEPLQRIYDVRDIELGERIAHGDVFSREDSAIVRNLATQFGMGEDEVVRFTELLDEQRQHPQQKPVLSLEDEERRLRKEIKRLIGRILIKQGRGSDREAYKKLHGELNRRYRWPAQNDMNVSQLTDKVRVLRALALET